MNYQIEEIDPGGYPFLLREITDPPKKLYIKGALPADLSNKFLCVVGARKHTNYGKLACEKIISGLSGLPIVIVSGLAIGLDALAHRAALSAGLTTLAVPGSGLDSDVLYPSSNRSLAREILEKGGALLSEFPPDFRARPESFPQRNRILAGLSHAVLVIEAEERSGTLITVRLALEYNRDVLALPGSIFSDASRGTNNLIKQGAIPALGSDTVIDALGLNFALADAREEGRSTGELSPDEVALFSLLMGPKTRDEIARTLKAPASSVNAMISQLEIKGFIVEQGGLLHRA